MKKYLSILAALVGIGLVAPPAQATVLVPGAPPVPVSALAALPAGAIVSNGGLVSMATFSAFDALGRFHYSGTLYFAVWQESATGFLDFVYQIANDKKSRDAIKRSTNVDFS